MPIPFLARGMVMSHDPDNDGMIVMLSSGSIPAFIVKRIYHGAVDAYRIDKPPLPVRGSWGLVAFPGGDIRNATWLGAYQPHQIDAITSEQADPFADYQSHFSGHWSLLHGLSGYISTQFADGSYFVASSGNNLATTYHHIVDDQQKRQRKELAFSDRNPTPQPTFAYTFSQSGTNFSGNLSPSGSLNVTWNQGQTLTLQQSGTGVSIFVDGNGNITVSAGSSNGTITFNAPQSMTFTTPNAIFSGKVTASGEVEANAGKSGLGSNIHLSTHKHGGVLVGGGQTDVPVTGS